MRPQDLPPRYSDFVEAMEAPDFPIHPLARLIALHTPLTLPTAVNIVRILNDEECEELYNFLQEKSQSSTKPNLFSRLFQKVKGLF